MSRHVRLVDSLPDYVQEAIKSGVPRTICPTCHGGQSKEISLAIRPQGQSVLKLSCWRATCDWYCLTIADPSVTLHRKKLKQGQVYTEPLLPITDHNVGNVLRQRYSLLEPIWKSHGWGVNPEDKSLVMPVHNPQGGTRGHVTRTLEPPKRCFTYKASAQPWLDWWVLDKTMNIPVVVVEDTISACRLAGLGYNAVALLGTSISVPQAQEIRDCAAGEKVWLALDRDAFEKATKLARRHAHICLMASVCLDRDIKDIPHDGDIVNIFGDYSGRDETCSRNLREQGCT